MSEWEWINETPSGEDDEVWTLVVRGHRFATIRHDKEDQEDLPWTFFVPLTREEFGMDALEPIDSFSSLEEAKAEIEKQIPDYLESLQSGE